MEACPPRLHFATTNPNVIELPPGIDGNQRTRPICDLGFGGLRAFLA